MRLRCLRHNWRQLSSTRRRTGPGRHDLRPRGWSLPPISRLRHSRAARSFNPRNESAVRGAGQEALMREAVIHGEKIGNAAPLNLSGRIPELDGLRGLAIGSVLIWHYFMVPTITAPATPLSYALVLGRLTWTGVDLFFVLSGFLIGGILLDARKASNYFQVFYTRRFFRIVPIYAAILLLFPALLAVAQRMHHGDFTGLQEPLPWYSFWTFTQNFWMVRA